MKETTSLATQRMVFGILFLIASLAAALAAEGLEQLGNNNILDNEKYRDSFEPFYVLSGGPSPTEVKSFVQRRIEEQSEGKIVLFGFRQIEVNVVDMELDGKIVCAARFEMGVEFNEPCRWVNRYQGRPLTFKVLKSGTKASSANDRNIFDISEKGERFILRGYALFTPDTNGWGLVGFGQSSRPVQGSVVPDEASARCISNLKMIRLGIETWAVDNDDQYPFNVSTNKGGTMELCRLGTDGFDQDAIVHFQIMSNELSTPKILVCPGDASKHPATSFANLRAENVSYRMRVGTNVVNTDSSQILAICPIHGHILYIDGHVEVGKKK
jgi:hypothetical protein